MRNTRRLVERYFASWNEKNAAARRTTIDEIWDEDASYLDPMGLARGRDAVDATIATLQSQFPDFAYSLAGTVDAHHNVARFSWEFGPVAGFSVVVINDNDQITSVFGFLDNL
ncbi:nuclear transport factor 2 family protein [Nonomuraea sp. NPDC050556]|uniref:nuclear transport factor 2 family protein n=1 Tax=Nonomuraea sp. NPDC050556 TaxID=3364369 RepID=UPI0037BB32B3